MTTAAIADPSRNHMMSRMPGTSAGAVVRLREMSGGYAIVANVAAADSALRLGARVVIHNIPGNPDHVFVRGLSRGGRVIMKWTSRARLTNFRSAWVHRSPPLRFDSKEAADKVIACRLTPSEEPAARTSDTPPPETGPAGR